MIGVTLAGFLSFLGQGTFILGYISSNNLFPEALTTEQEKVYIKRMQKGDLQAKNILIEHNLRLVAHVCKKYTNSKIDQDDLISIGSIGLIKGINTYNPEKSIKLSTYISKCIDNEILMFFRSSKKTNKEVYLEDPIGKDKDDNTVTLKDVLENDEKPIDEEIDLNMKTRALYQQIKHSLTKREQQIVIERYGLDGKKARTQIEIAKELGISRSYVSRIETKAINKLKKELIF